MNKSRPFRTIINSFADNNNIGYFFDISCRAAAALSLTKAAVWVAAPRDIYNASRNTNIKPFSIYAYVMGTQPFTRPLLYDDDMNRLPLPKMLTSFSKRFPMQYQMSPKAALDASLMPKISLIYSLVNTCQKVTSLHDTDNAVKHLRPRPALILTLYNTYFHASREHHRLGPIGWWVFY